MEGNAHTGRALLTDERRRIKGFQETQYRRNPCARRATRRVIWRPLGAALVVGYAGDVEVQPRPLVDVRFEERRSDGAIAPPLRRALLAVGALAFEVGAMAGQD